MDEKMDEKQKRFEEILESIRRRMAADALSGNPVRRKAYGRSPNIDDFSFRNEQVSYILDHR